MESVDNKLLAAAIKRLQAIKLRDCFNPDNLDSRPTEKQLEVLRDTVNRERYVVAGNRSGKTQLGAREVSWWFENCHPFMERPESWGKGPLMILVMGRVAKQVEEEIWNNKIKPFLMPGTYKEVRNSSGLEKVVNVNNGNRILFLSHHNANEAREKAQGFTAHYVWIDEMPSSVALINELRTRVFTARGKFLATFTPLIRNEEIMQMVEASEEPISRKYQFSMMDNPIMKAQEAEILAAYAHMPEPERNARLYGDWYVGDLVVYPYNADNHMLPGVPMDYDPYVWPHVEAVDPAASGLVGMIIAAYSPHSERWYIVRSELLEGAAPSELVQTVYEIGRKYNIVRRVCDPHEAWFRKEAAIATGSRPGLTYLGVYKKTERKKELITNIQNALINGTLKLFPTAKELAKEFTNCQWSDTVEDKIVNSSKWHLCDATQYFWDVKPKELTIPDAPKSFDAQMRSDNAARKQREAKVKQTKIQRRSWSRKRWHY